MNKINLGNILLGIFIILLLSLLVVVFSTPAHPSQTGVCCAITVEQTSSHTATVHYWSSNNTETHDMYVSVEYPDEDYTTQEQLDDEIDYAIHELQELCYHNHFVPQSDIETRALTMKEKDCYTWQDIEIIVFGEIQE